MEEQLALIPCKKCGLLPYIVEDPVFGYILKHNPECDVVITPPVATSKAEALYEIINTWNQQMSEKEE